MTIGSADADTLAAGDCVWLDGVAVAWERAVAGLAWSVAACACMAAIAAV